MKRGLVEAHYFPTITYFLVLKSLDEVIIERQENYSKQSYRNRCLINTSNGVHTLVIPIVSQHKKVPITEVRIDYSQKWVDNHWRTIKSAYGKAPFFEYYADDFYSILGQKHEFLYFLNREILSMAFAMLNWNMPVLETVMYEKTPIQTIIDFRNAINPKNTGQRKINYTAVKYHQVFGDTFIPDLSILDLIFCVGPEASNLMCISCSETNKSNTDNVNMRN